MLKSSHSAARFLVIAMCLVNIASAQNQQPCNPKATITDFAWFAGHWTADQNGSHIDEYWSAPMGGSSLE